MHHINQNCVERNDQPPGMYNKVNQVRFKTSMSRSGICDYNDTYILVNGTKTVAITLELKTNQIMPPIKR